MRASAHPIRIVDVTDHAGRVVEPTWLAAAERVHRQLRPQLPTAYVDTMQRVFAGGGRMALGLLKDRVAGVAVWRVHENTCFGLHMYVDDLVTDETERSTGVGHALMDHMQHIAHQLGCTTYTLDSGTQRQQAHKFYFREGLIIQAFHFTKPLT